MVAHGMSFCNRPKLWYVESSIHSWGKLHFYLMKVCYISNLYPPNTVGGAGQVVFRQAKARAAAGDEVHVITAVPPAARISRTSIEEGVVVHRLIVPNFFFYTQLAEHCAPIRFLWHLRDWFQGCGGRSVRVLVETIKPDEVHTHNLMGIGFLIPRAIQSLGIKHIHTLHDVQLVHPSGILPAHYEDDSFFVRMHMKLMKWLFASPDVIISPTAFLKDFYQKRGFFLKSDWQVRPNFIEEAAAVHARPLKSFAYVGTLSEHKGVKVLLDAWREYDDPGAELHIAGCGPLHDVVEQAAAADDRIQVDGLLTKDKLQRLYKKTDALIVPSVCIENRPNVIAEALAHGIVIIASESGGIPEMLKDVSRCSLVLPNDPAALLSAMRST